MLDTLSQDALAFLLYHINRRQHRYLREWLERIAVENGQELPVWVAPDSVSSEIERGLADFMAVRLRQGATGDELVSKSEFKTIVDAACRKTLGESGQPEAEREKKIVAFGKWHKSHLRGRYLPANDPETVRGYARAALELATKAGITPQEFLEREEAWDEIIRLVHPTKRSFEAHLVSHQCSAKFEEIISKPVMMVHDKSVTVTDKQEKQLIREYIRLSLEQAIQLYRPLVKKEVQRLWPSKTDIQ
ncbi:MAG: hypothetical protein AAB692_04095 [Patescibacteria group bacterium]